MPANYQHIKSEDMPVVSNLDNSIELKVVAGKQVNELGLIKTQTEVNVFMVKTTGKGAMEINIPTSHETLIYLLDGEIIINDTVNLKKGASQMITFNQDGNRIHLNSVVESNVLILSGEPLNEKIAQYGPYVMNTQTEIMEATRDYQMRKMGYLSN